MVEEGVSHAVPSALGDGEAEEVDTQGVTQYHVEVFAYEETTRLAQLHHRFGEAGLVLPCRIWS